MGGVKIGHTIDKPIELAGLTAIRGSDRGLKGAGPAPADDRRQPGAGGPRRRRRTLAGLALLLAVMLPAQAPALEAWPAEQFRQSVGVNTHFGHSGIYINRAADVKRALIDSGILNIRERVSPRVAEQARSLWLCCRIRTLARIDYRLGDRRNTRLDPTKIEGEIDKALAIGAAGLVGFEGPNEYTAFNNTGDWDGDLRDYMARIRAVRDRKGLSTPIVGPTVYLRSLADLRQLGNIRGSIDASNLHYYTGGYEPSWLLDKFMTEVQIMAPGEPVWITEYGYHYSSILKGGVSEIAAARYLPRSLANFFSRSPRGKFFLYELMDEGTSHHDNEMVRGLVRYDMSRKPSFYTVRRLIRQVSGGTPGLAARPLDIRLGGQTAGVKTLLLQKTASQYLLLLWQEARSWEQARRVNINVPRKGVTVSLPRVAAVSQHDTLPFPANPAADVPPLRISGGTNRTQVNVPDHIVMLQLDLR